MKRPPQLTLKHRKGDSIQVNVEGDVENESEPESPLASGVDDGLLAEDLAALDALRKSVQNNLRLRPLTGKSPGTAYFTPMATPFMQGPQPISASALAALLDVGNILIIDTRATQPSSITGSVNIAIPSLILKRFQNRKQKLTLSGLSQYVVSEQGRERLDDDFGGPVIVCDNEISPIPDSSMTWTLLNVLSTDTELPIYFISIEEVIGHAQMHRFLRRPDPTGGLFQLDTNQLFKPKGGPVELTQSASASTASSLKSHTHMLPKSSSSSVKSSATRSAKPTPLSLGMNDNFALVSARLSHDRRASQDMTNIPPSISSAAPFQRPNPPLRIPSEPLLKLKTRSTDRLPKLQINNLPPPNSALLKVATEPKRPKSPSALKLTHSNHDAADEAMRAPKEAQQGNWTVSPASPPAQTPFYTPPHTPKASDDPPLTSFYSALPPSPATARPTGLPPWEPGTPPAFSPSESAKAMESSPASFTVSTILPNFLFLGPEPTLPEHAAELQALGVKRIINIAAECDDSHGLHLRDPAKSGFEKYTKIGLKDAVEEEGIGRGVRDACMLLDDARLHSSPTYVHCRAGKSRSVTAVIAYLIHSHHWPLSRAYAFVLERRKGISPNIGFVSELMSFEEEELGTGRSGGVSLGSGTAPGSATNGTASSGMPSGGKSAPANSKGKPIRQKHQRSNTHTYGSLSLRPEPPLNPSTTSDSSSSDSEGGDSDLEDVPKAPSETPDGPGLSHHPTRPPRSLHIRESLPPPATTSSSTLSSGLDFSLTHTLDPQQEMEVKDKSGRYRHARRAPVDENTLQPMRRVSKAGLESGIPGSGWG